jgi:hypothetical protein
MMQLSGATRNFKPATGTVHVGNRLRGVSEKSGNSKKLFIWHVMGFAVPRLISVATNWPEVRLGLQVPVRGVTVTPCAAEYSADPPLRDKDAGLLGPPLI